MSELEQTKKVLDVIANLINEKETCTYRHLIYDLLEFKEDAYSELISGLTITNFLVYVKEQAEEIERLKEEYMILQNASDEVEEEKDREIERQKEIIRQLDIKNLELTTIIKEVRECINHYAIENEDYSKIYNDEEKELLEILDKEK